MKVLSFIHAALLNNILRGALLFGDDEKGGEEDPNSPPTK